MTAAQKRIVGKASGTTAVAVVAALAVFIIARWITGAPIDERDWLETIFIPIIVGMPIACYVFAQAEKLRSAYVELAELNAVCAPPEPTKLGIEREQFGIPFLADHPPLPDTSVATKG